MLIVTAKVPRRKLAIGTALAALACCCAVVLNLSNASLTQEVSSPVAPTSTGIKTNEDRIEYLRSYGWEVVSEPLATQELVIPKEMDDSYSEYLKLQAQQGFSPEQYAGKRVKRYTYEITNYPSGEMGIQVNLLIYKNTVIGGEVLSPQLDGFLHGLTMPPAQKNS